MNDKLVKIVLAFLVIFIGLSLYLGYNLRQAQQTIKQETSSVPKKTSIKKESSETKKKAPPAVVTEKEKTSIYTEAEQFIQEFILLSNKEYRSLSEQYQALKNFYTPARQKEIEQQLVELVDTDSHPQEFENVGVYLSSYTPGTVTVFITYDTPGETLESYCVSYSLTEVNHVFKIDRLIYGSPLNKSFGN